VFVPAIALKSEGGPGATLLVADHTAYHVGQFVIIRRALGVWK
jgi:hypothetical protein